MLTFESADMTLRVELQSDLSDQVELCLQEIDVMFLVLHQNLKQVPRDIIPDAAAVSRRLLIERTGADLEREITLDDFLDVLADPVRDRATSRRPFNTWHRASSGVERHGSWPRSSPGRWS